MGLKLRAGEFYGTTAQVVAANGFRLTEKSYSSQTKLPTHAHELSHFCFVLAGNYTETIFGRNFDRDPAALVYYPPDVSHGEQHFSNGRHFLVEVNSSQLEKIRDYGANLSEPVELRDNSSLWLASRMYKEFTERDRFSALILESISIELLIEASRQPMRRPERNAPAWLERAKECLRENFSDPPCLGDLAQAVNVHPTHLARVFRQFEHCTVGDYIREVRIDYARQRILNSAEPLVDIALAAGFADQTHFTRSFKRVTGLTPSDFRRIFARLS